MEKMEIFKIYSQALDKGDFKTVFDCLSDDIEWHMGGQGPLSGTVKGKEALGGCFGEFAQRSHGTFKVLTDWYASNGCFVAAKVVSIAERAGHKLEMPGIDLFKIEDGKIREVWTFAEDQDKEDDFWG